MKCIVCGNEGERPRSKFCCKKCEQKYYYETRKGQRKEYKKQYYIKNKNKCDKIHNEWLEKNRERWNEYQKEQYKNKKEE